MGFYKSLSIQEQNNLNQFGICLFFVAKKQKKKLKRKESKIFFHNFNFNKYRL